MKKDKHKYDAPRFSDFNGDGVWATKLGFYLLWMEYLAVSPSYELARRYRQGGLNHEERETLPKDFETVLAVYDNLGDVQRVLFLDWWRDHGLPVFGYEGDKPSVSRVDTLRSTRHRRASERLEDFITGTWTAQGQPNSMLVSIPIGLSKIQITRQLNRLMAKYPDEQKVLPEPIAKYPLVGSRQRKDTLFRYLFVVWVRCAMPRQALWRIGARSRVSDTYSRELNPKARLKRGEQNYDRNTLAVLTSRAWNRGLALAENAARGKFPCYEMPQHAVSPDLHELGDLITSRRRWKKQSAAGSSTERPE